MPIISGAGSVASGGGGLTLLFSQTLGANAATIDSGTLATTFTHLLVMTLLRTTGGASRAGFRFNNDSGTNYGTVLNVSDGTSLTTGKGTGATSMDMVMLSDSGRNANDWASSFTFIPFYGSAFWKSAIPFGIYLTTERWSGGTWESTAAVSRIQVADYLGGGQLVAGSALYVYAM